MLKPLNESPSEKEGKSTPALDEAFNEFSLKESPSEKEGKFAALRAARVAFGPSMKVPPKRKGNRGVREVKDLFCQSPQ